MIRTLLAVVLLIVAVLWTPVWLQVALFVCAIIFLPYRILFIVPAIVADTLYAPTDLFRVGNFTYTLYVLIGIIVWLTILNQTRISDVIPKTY